MTEKTHPPGRGHGLHPFQTWGQAPVNARKGRHHQEHFHHAAASHYHIAFGGPGFAGPAMGGVFPRQHPTFTYAVPGVYGPYHRPILAERFKTKMCANWTETGACPYFFRCMFAHGEHEMRTKQMNMADGLYTEEAIKAFKRAAYESSKRNASAKPAPIVIEYPYTTAQTGCGCDCPVVAAPSIATHPILSSDACTAVMIGGTSTNTDSTDTSSAPSVPFGDVALVCAAVTEPSPRARRHDPYAERSAWHPLQWVSGRAAAPATPPPAPMSGSSTPSSQRSGAAPRRVQPARPRAVLGAAPAAPTSARMVVMV